MFLILLIRACELLRVDESNGILFFLFIFFVFSILVSMASEVRDALAILYIAFDGRSGTCGTSNMVASHAANPDLELSVLIADSLRALRGGTAGGGEDDLDSGLDSTCDNGLITLLCLFLLEALLLIDTMEGRTLCIDIVTGFAIWIGVATATSSDSSSGEGIADSGELMITENRSYRKSEGLAREAWSLTVGEGGGGSLICAVFTGVSGRSN